MIVRQLLAALIVVWTTLASANAQTPAPPYGPGSIPFNPFSINGWSPQWSLRPDANQGTASGGNGLYAAGEVVTLNDGCLTHASLNVLTLSSGNPALFSVHAGGSCSFVPADAVTQLSSTGSGSGASFTLRPYWGPIAGDLPAATVNGSPNGAMFYPPSLSKGVLNPALGAVCAGPPGSCGGGYNNGDGQGIATGMTGGENVLFGLAGPQLTTAQWITAMGWNVAGHETDGQFDSYFGTDVAKYGQHNTSANAFGRNDLKFAFNLTGVSIFGSDSAGGAQNAQTITGVVSGTGGVCRYTVSSTALFLTGDYGVVTGVAGTGGVTACNAESNITVVDATHFETTAVFAGTYVSGGTANDYPFNNTSRLTVLGTTSLSGASLRAATRLVILGDTAAQAVTTAVDDVMAGSGVGNACTTCNQNTMIQGGATLATGAGNTLVGFHSDVTGTATANGVAIGGAGNGGGIGARVGSSGVTLGAKSGNASLTGRGILIGPSVGTTNCGTGNDFIEIFTNGGDCSASNAANEIQIGTGATAWLSVTGTNTVTTSVPILHGTLNLPDVASSAAALDALCWNATGGVVTHNAAGALCSASLEELKDIVGVIDPKQALDKVLDLRPIWAKFKDSVSSTSDHGIHPMLGAHQVEGVDRRLAAYDGSGKLLSVQYLYLSALNSAAIQALEQKISKLENGVHQ